jgi:hypothetical protein
LRTPNVNYHIYFTNLGLRTYSYLRNINRCFGSAFPLCGSGTSAGILGCHT